MMKVKEKLRVIASITLVGILMSSPVMSAPQLEQPDNVTLVATLNNGPAMRAVSWSVYRLDPDGNKTFVRNLTRHSASFALAPGRYQAEAQLKTIKRARTFEVARNSTSAVVIAMD